MKNIETDPLTDCVLDIVWNLTGRDFDYELSRFAIYVSTAIGAVILFTQFK